MPTPGEILAARIAEYVTSVVPQEQAQAVFEATCRAIATLMNDPFFVAHLQVVKELREENQWLKHQVVALNGALTRSVKPRTTSSPKKAATPKRSSSKTAASLRAPKSAQTAFKTGFKQARR